MYGYMIRLMPAVNMWLQGQAAGIRPAACQKRKSDKTFIIIIGIRIMRHSRTHSFLRFSPMGKVTDVLVSLIGAYRPEQPSCWHDWPHEQPPRSPPVTGPPGWYRPRRW